MRVALPDSRSGDARRQLRASLAARRRAVSPAARAQAALRAAHHADRALHLRCGWRIAVYAALPEELDTAPLVALALRRGCRLYLPRIDRRRRSRRMRFVEMHGPMRANRLGIAEPECAATIGARWLDLVFLPLVGFDAQGLRLGTGGGFYDRAFAFRLLRREWQAPRLVGFGYAFQQVERIARAPHDVALDAVATDEGFLRCTTG
ncbi:MAG TPA: 5-formyltetrahydrofolate cyclo-ligase [Steroidobacteraceae bacterium]|nr:5-formyltetrahydrofolate cyclo-ligase [Steroidobacteraceae bacterium]